ncbi:MAG: site-specific recombinase, partial [Gallionellaceae bacterium]|nr:site-specific recombinase [Gallionellaceae bacterium]
MNASITRLRDLINSLRPPAPDDIASAERNIWAEVARLTRYPDDAALLKQDLQTLLSLPRQTPFYSETGIQSALGFWLELKRRINYRLLPPAFDDSQLSHVLARVFSRASDYQWVTQVNNDAWIELASAIGLHDMDPAEPSANLYYAARVLSYQISGIALDRELLHAARALEKFESPFLAQNATLVPMLERALMGGAALSAEEVREVDVLLDQCDTVLARSHNRATETGISIRLTYMLARLQQLMDRLRQLLELLVAENRLPGSVGL